MNFLKRYSIWRTICAIPFAEISNFIIAYDWFPISSLLSFCLMDSNKAMLLAPRAIAGAIPL